MGHGWIHRSACLLAGGLLLWAPAEARCDPASEPFEVIVMRGGSVSRVTGTPSGEIHEELLREDPHPAKPEPAPRPARPARKQEDGPRRAVVVYVVPGTPTAYPVYLGDSHFRRHGPHPRGYKPIPQMKRRRGPGGWPIGRVRRP